MSQANKYYVRGEGFHGVVLAYSAADAVLQWELAHEDDQVACVWPCFLDRPTVEDLDRWGGCLYVHGTLG